MRPGFALLGVASILAAAAIIAASILFIGRWQITSIGYGFAGGGESRDNDTQIVYRLDRWTGEIEQCSMEQSGLATEDAVKAAEKRNKLLVYCGWPKQPAAGPEPSRSTTQE